MCNSWYACRENDTRRQQDDDDLLSQELLKEIADVASCMVFSCDMQIIAHIMSIYGYWHG